MKRIALLIMWSSCIGAMKNDCRKAPTPQVNMIFHDMPELKTKRLRLCTISDIDEGDIFEIYSDEETAQNLMRPAMQSKTEAYDLIKRFKAKQNKNLPAPWVIREKTSTKIIGICGFHECNPANAQAQLVITLNRNYWRKGYMREAAQAAAEFGFDTMNLNAISWLVRSDNKAIYQAYKAYGKQQGIERVATLKEGTYFDGAYRNLTLYRLLKRDYEKNAYSNQDDNSQ